MNQRFKTRKEFAQTGNFPSKNARFASKETGVGVTPLASTKIKMDERTNLLKQNIDELQEQIGIEEAKAEQLRKKNNSSVGENYLQKENS